MPNLNNNTIIKKWSFITAILIMILFNCVCCYHGGMSKVFASTSVLTDNNIVNSDNLFDSSSNTIVPGCYLFANGSFLSDNTGYYTFSNYISCSRGDYLYSSITFRGGVDFCVNGSGYCFYDTNNSFLGFVRDDVFCQVPDGAVKFIYNIYTCNGSNLASDIVSYSVVKLNCVSSPELYMPYNVYNRVNGTYALKSGYNNNFELDIARMSFDLFVDLNGYVKIMNFNIKPFTGYAKGYSATKAVTYTDTFYFDNADFYNNLSAGVSADLYPNISKYSDSDTSALFTRFALCYNNTVRSVVNNIPCINMSGYERFAYYSLEDFSNLLLLHASNGGYFGIYFVYAGINGSEAIDTSVRYQNYFNIDYDQISDDSKYSMGYDSGYNDGNSLGLATGYDNGYSAGMSKGYSQGYNKRNEEFSNSNANVKSLIFAICDAPFNVLHNAFNFEIFGVNLSAFLIAVVSLLIISFVINKLR